MSDAAIQSGRNFGLAILTIGIISAQTGWLEMERTEKISLLSHVEVILNIYSLMEKQIDSSVFEFQVEHRFESGKCEGNILKKTEELAAMGRTLQDNSRGVNFETRVYEIRVSEADCLDRAYAVNVMNRSDHQSPVFLLIPLTQLK